MALVRQAKEDGESDERDADDDGEQPKPVFLDVFDSCHEQQYSDDRSGHHDDESHGYASWCSVMIRLCWFAT